MGAKPFALRPHPESRLAAYIIPSARGSTSVSHGQ